MNKKPCSVPAASKLSLLRQLCNHIPECLVPKLARQTKAQEKVRTFSAWSHCLALMYAQLTHCLSLNDVCDALRLHASPLANVRGATAPSRNTLSHANRVRPAALAEALFWEVFRHLGQRTPAFCVGSGRPRFARRFRRTIHLVDSTTIPLIASCLDWAKHRRRKAAAKCHLRLDLRSFLPRVAIVGSAGQADVRCARALCAGVQAGEIVVFDKAYTDFPHLAELTARGVFWVTRAKADLSYRVHKRQQRQPAATILRDEVIGLRTAASQCAYPQRLRRVVALVTIQEQEVAMEFLTNNLTWSASQIAQLYRCRWQIEVFFKQVKQTLQLSDFLGTSANAVRWQIWMALLVYLLLRYLAFLSQWPHSFSRLFTLLRSVVWRKCDLLGLLRHYGTAGGSFWCRQAPPEAFLPGVNWHPYGTAA